MVKTQIFIVCDKCEKPFKDSDPVYGYAAYDDARIAAYTMDEKNYTDYYFDEECFKSIKTNTLSKLKASITNIITSGFINKEVDIYVPYIRQSYKLHNLDFAEKNAWYFCFNYKDNHQLIKINSTENGLEYICFEEVVDLMFKDFKYGILHDLRNEFKIEGNRRKLESQTASSICCSASDAISGCVTTKAYI